MPERKEDYYFMRKERITSITLLRCICMLGIVLEHCLGVFRQYNKNFILLEKINFLENCNLGFGGVGAAIFFMISGAVLIYNYSDEKFCIKKFYISRFIKMCPVLYGLHITVWIIYSVIQGRPVYTITGLTVLRALTGRALVGEWFTVVIFLCYILFPLLRFLFKRYKWPVTIALLFICIADWKYKFLVLGGNAWFSFSNGIFEFWLGMLLVDARKKMKKFWNYALALILVSIPMWSLRLDTEYFYYFPTLLVSVILFLLIIQTRREITFANKISDCSYEIYLTHHQIMYILFPFFADSIYTQGQYLLFFIFLMILIYLISREVHILNGKFISAVLYKKTVIEKKNWMAFGVKVIGAVILCIIMLLGNEISDLSVRDWDTEEFLPRIGREFEVEEGTYLFTNVLDPELSLGIEGGYADDGALLMTGSDNGNASIFYVVQAEQNSKTYYIRPSHDNSTLQESIDQGKKRYIAQYANEKTGTEIWKFIYAGEKNGKTMVVLENANGLAVQSQDSLSREGSEVVLADLDVNADSQKWYMIWAEKDSEEKDRVVYRKGNTVLFDEGIYSIVSAEDESVACTVSEQEQQDENSQAILAEPCTWSQSQKFEFRKYDESHYKIYLTTEKNKCLEYDRNTGTIKVEQEADNMDQLFYITYLEKDACLLKTVDGVMLGYRKDEDSKQVKISINSDNKLSESLMNKWYFIKEKND